MPWTGKSRFSTRALVRATFSRLRNAFKHSVFEASKLVSTKTPLLKNTIAAIKVMTFFLSRPLPPVPFWIFAGFLREPPDVGVAPTALWRVPPPIPSLRLEDPFPQATVLPSPFSLPLPPNPWAPFEVLREAAAGVGEGSLGGRGRGAGGPQSPT